MSYSGNNRRGRIKIAPNAHPCVKRFTQRAENKNGWLNVYVGAKPRELVAA